jgi:hypothetical protein
MKKLLVLICWMFFFAANGYASMFTYNRWQQNNVQVCFVDPDQDPADSLDISLFSAEQKNSVQAWLNEEYTEARTGIYFSGFQSCDQAINPDVVVYLRQEPVTVTSGRVELASATLGQTPTRPSIRYQSARGAVYLSQSGLNKSVVIHEFGHIAGLYHEHDHPDADQACTYNNERDKQVYAYRGYLPYDHDSIMSYCVINQDKNRGLSSEDIQALRLLYINHVTALTPEQPMVHTFAAEGPQP